MRNTGLIALLIALAALASPVAAQLSNDEWVRNCQRQNRNGGEVHCEVRESRIPARGTVRVDVDNSPVSVRAWEGSDVLVRARVQARAGTQAAARELAGRVRVNTEGTIGATGPQTQGRDAGWAVSYEIMVPARSNLDLRTENGPVSVHRVSGTIQVRADNGPVDLRELGGTVNARARNGPITVTLAGRRWNGSGLDVQTENGPVTLRMPRGYAARLEASTVNGPLNVPGPVQRDGRRGRRVSTDLNGGGPTLRASTTNGPLTVRES